MTSPSYMRKLHGRPRSPMTHRRYRGIWPNYTLPSVAECAQHAQGNPPAFVPGTNMPDMPYERVAMNGYGSYYQSTPNYYRNPVPYTESDIGAPVPGWGVNASVAGPARVGVGADLPPVVRLPAAFRQRVAYEIPGGGDMVGGGGETNGGAADDSGLLDDETLAEASQVGGVAWYVWPIAAAVVLGGVGYYGTKKGWF